MKEIISIIVPIYKVEKELERCVQSLLQQTYPDIEIILVDDGSPDKCPILCDGYARKDRRVKVIHKTNGGLSDARNAGLRAASGTYVMFVDSDDYLEPDACKQLLSGMQNEVDFVVGVIRQIDGASVTFQKRSNIKPGRVYTSKEFIIESIKKNEWYAPAILNLYRRRFLIDNELFYKVGFYYEDHEMLPRLYLAAKRITYVDYPFYNYVIRGGSIMTSENSWKKIDDSLTIWSEWLDILERLEDRELQRYMYGILIQYYLHNSRARKITGWQIKGMDFQFAFRYALGFKERLKVLFYTVFPRIYIHIG